MMRQVFWLVPAQQAFPSRLAEQWSGVWLDHSNGIYSYGYSAGIAPVFPF